MKRTILALAVLAASFVIPALPAGPAPSWVTAAYAQDEGADEAREAEGMDTEALDGDEAEGEEPAGKPAREELTPEALAVREVVGDYAIAMANFPARRDVESITRHFTEDYVKLNDGLEETAADTVAIFSEIREQITIGNPVTVTARIDDFYGEAADGLAWGTYRFYFKTLVSGELFTEEDKSCSAVLEKHDGTWLIRLEHCTSVFTEE